MYQSFWGLKEKPFQNTPDPRFLYFSRRHEESLSRLLYTVQEGLGAAVLTGVFGTGKTVLAQAFFEKVGLDKHRIAFITNPQMDYVELLRSIVRHLDPGELPTLRSEYSPDYFLERLEKTLLNNIQDGKETIILIDEAHLIKEEAILEGLRLLLNFQQKDRFLLTLILLGQPELRPKILSIKQLDQRIAMKCHLEALTGEDTKAYIFHRLGVAGCKGNVFLEGAIRFIFDRSGGIPRRINQLCDLSLLSAFSLRKKEVDEEIVQEAVRDLGEEVHAL